MNSQDLGSRGATIGAIVVLGIAAITGVIGWSFNNILENARLVDRCGHEDVWQDKQIDELAGRLKAIELWEYSLKYKGVSTPP